MDQANAEPPPMNEEEVANFMRETLKVRVRKEDLEKPTYESVFNIYNCFLSEFGISNVAQVDLEACQNMDHFEQFDEFIPSINLVQTLHGLVGTETNPVRLTDLRIPTRRRTMNIVNKLIAIWVNLVELKSEWEKVKAKHSQFPENIRIVTEKIASIQQENDQLSAQLTRAKPNGQKIREQIREKAATLEKLKSQATTLQEEVRKTRTEAAEQEETKSTLMMECERYRDEISSTEQNVIRSPQKIIALTQEKSNQLDARRATKREVGMEYNQILNETDLKNKMGTQLEGVLGTMKLTFEDLTAIREKCDSIDSADKNIVARELKSKELDRLVEQRKNSTAALKAQTTAIRSQNAIRIASIREELSQAKDALDLKMSQQNSADQKLLEEERSLLKEISNIEISEQQVKKRAEERQALVNAKAEALHERWSAALKEKGII